MSKSGECVKVVVRCRPLSETEIKDGRVNVVKIDSQSVTIEKPGSQQEPAKEFSFDYAFSPEISQEEIYTKTGAGIVDNVLQGYNGTIFAYGQTGTGKSFTMVGASLTDKENRGLIPRAFEQIFEAIKTNSSPNTRFLVHASYLEIYNEEIRDLLSKTPKEKLDLRDRPDSGVYVKDLSTAFVESPEQIHKVLTLGHRNRSVGATLMNQESSRSHSIFSVTVETATTDSAGKEHIRVGKLNLVDLAGSERQSKTGSSGDQLKEATKINLSLSALGNVISSLVDPKATFVPYRDSKLTRLLQDSLGGNTKTVMVANIGPADYNFDESLSTLRYANRAKSIKNKPRINEDPKDAMIRKYQEEIEALKRDLANAAAGREVVVEKVVEKVVNVGPSEEEVREMTRKISLEQEKQRSEYERERREIMAAKSMAEEERESLLEELRRKEDAQEAQRKQQQALISKLRNMEAKLIQGTEVLENAAKQEKELQKAKRELEEKRLEEARIQAMVKEQEEERNFLVNKFDSQADQVAKLSLKLERLLGKYRQLQAEATAAAHDFNQEREALLETVRDTEKEKSMLKLIIKEFIPDDELELIKNRCSWDSDSEAWRIEKAGNSPRQTDNMPASQKGFSRPWVPGKLIRAPNMRVPFHVDLEISKRRSSDLKEVADDVRDMVLSNLDSHDVRYFVLNQDGSLSREEIRSRSSAKRPSTTSKKVTSADKQTDNIQDQSFSSTSPHSGFRATPRDTLRYSRN